LPPPLPPPAAAPPRDDYSMPVWPAHEHGGHDDALSARVAVALDGGGAVRLTTMALLVDEGSGTLFFRAADGRVFALHLPTDVARIEAAPVLHSVSTVTLALAAAAPAGASLLRAAPPPYHRAQPGGAMTLYFADADDAMVFHAQARQFVR
jgi:hypothetical protein